MRRQAARTSGSRDLTADAEWYKDAIIYELRVRSFFDSNGDGVGDFAGLAAKLDYLSDLGVTALWILPFYPSPLRDDGYDISDYTDVNPDMGTLDDFRHFLAEAHARGLRVITELVLNHTSDQHPWFQRARRAKPGTPERDFYVWSATPAPYRDARIIFKDFETSNWTWDPVANEYFWHRFYSHQPDLNFENPAVQDALLSVVDFWLALGVDGLRLDAVPYLYEQDGTSCENLPKTHAFLRRLRAHIDAQFSNRMLLAEANQWPEDAAAYFGSGDECQMNFHFPIMPRMFMAIHMEDSFPIVDILAQTPTPPPSCQWALFLRNHDELTLEMVTDDERDYMYLAYASESAARINLGIRRRLAPLVGNDRRKVELLNGLLFSLSGTPVLYYGDEIGMGDNIFLGDRNGVRTPMQWSMDRNAGFSRANTQRLILPVNTNAEYHYESLNVEAQQNNPTSLLWWTKRLIALRRDFRAFGRGTLEVLTVSNARILAFLRRFGDETILVVANLSRAVQFVSLDLSAHKGLRPVELFGGAALPPIGDVPYTLTLSGHAFYWLSLERALGETPTVMPSSLGLPLIPGAGAGTLRGEGIPELEDALPAALATRRWFRGRGRDLQEVRVLDVIPWGGGETPLTCFIVRVEYAEGEAETYPLWLTVSSGNVVEALEDPLSARAFVDGLANGRRFPGRRGSIVVSGPERPIFDEANGAPHSIPGVHANALVQLDDSYVLKIFHRAPEGTSIDLEIERALGELGCSPVHIVGDVTYVRAGEPPVTLAMLEGYVPNVGTAWHYALADVERYYERVLTTRRNDVPPAEPPLLLDPGAEVPLAIRDLLGNILETMTVLGQRTAELHRNLLKLTGAALAPEESTPLSKRSEYQTLRNLSGNAMRQLRDHQPRLHGVAAVDAAFVLERKAAVLEWFEPLLREQGLDIRIRCHGDFHLGQVLFTGKDFVILDFEGELDRSFNARRRKRSPLRDVACMLRSIENAALVALWEPGTVREVDRELLSPWARVWDAWASSFFLAGYRQGAAGTPLFPARPHDALGALHAFMLERTLRDLSDELEWQADGTIIPLHALARMLESDLPRTTRVNAP
jgi:maltose alpha-D-glucosyltransferase/alpha-amylase